MIIKVKETTDFLKEKGFENPEVGIVLGTGLGALINKIDDVKNISYEKIPHFPLATVEYHKGELFFGKIGNVRVIVMQGRFHYYEGYTMSEIVFPIRVMKFLGVKKLLISNVSGCMNLNWKKGELMLISDHINLQPENPLRGKDASAFGSIFTDLSQPYDQQMNDELISIAKENNVTLRKGVYAAVTGPNLETKSEYRFLKQIGADVVGMSTVPEVIAANQLKLPVAAITVMTDICDPDNLKPIDIDNIINTAKKGEKNMIILFEKLIKTI